MTPERILVGIDFEASSAAALDWIRGWLIDDTELVLVHAIEPIAPPAFLRPLLPEGEAMQAAECERARQRMDQLAAHIDHPALSTFLQVGRAADVMAEAASAYDADLLVIGEHTASHPVPALTGSVADHVLHQATAPILLARRIPEGAPSRALVAIDGSPISERVLGWAAYLNREHGTAITLLHVLETHLAARVAAVSSVKSAHRFEEQLTDSVDAWLRVKLREAGLVEEETRVCVVNGNPSHELLHQASEMRAEMVVLGTRGAGVVGRALVGSVARAASHGAECPVLMVPERED